eukprot:XP_015578103.1 uncharacterized protein LOC8288333 [Ricinus communis]
MASNPEEALCNSLTDEETVALRKKRSRRVSFADREITSVHIFNRDEDFETPPDSSSAKKQSSHSISEAENEVIGFFRDLADSDDYKDMSPNDDNEDDDDDGAVTARKSFLRPIESPSPGSSTVVGSATSNDEDNFFGPVSTSFIRHRTLSDSAASDDNHDVTMDSTAFSMHFRSLARSDSGGNTFIEEKTPSHITTPNSGSLMVLTKAKKIVPQFSLPVEKVSGGRDSNDMSLVGENPRNYDYGKLSPRLEALLAEGSKDVKDIFVSDCINPKSLKRSGAFMSDENLDGHKDQRDYEDKATGNTGNLGISTVGVSVHRMELDEANSIFSTNHVDQIISGSSSHKNEDLVADISVDQGRETPNQRNKMNNDYTKATVGTNFPAVSGVGPQSMDGEVIQFNPFEQYESRHISNDGCLEKNSPKDRRGNCGIYQNPDRQLRSPLVGSTPSMSDKQQKIFFNAAKASGQLSYVTPSPKQPGSFIGKENIRSDEIMRSTHRSSSRFNIFEPSPLANTLKDGIERSKLRLSRLHSSTTFPCNDVAEENCIDIRRRNVDAPVVNLEEHLSTVDDKNRHHERTGYMGNTGIGNLKNHGSVSKNQGVVTLAEEEESLIPMPKRILSEEEANQMMTEVASPFQFTQSHKKARQHILMPEKSAQHTMVVFGSDSSSIDIKLDHRNNVRTMNPPDDFVSSPAKTLDQKLSSSAEQQGTLSHDFQNEELISTGLGQDKSSTGNIASDSLSSPKPVLTSCHDNQSYPTNLLHASETLPSFGTPLRERDALKFLSGNSNKNVPLASKKILSGKEVPVERNEAFLHTSASPSIRRGIFSETALLKIPFQKEMTQSPIKQELMGSPSRKDLFEVSNDDNVQSLAGKSTSSTNSTSNGPAHGDSRLEFHISNTQIFAQDTENSSLHKRGIEESVPEDASHVDKIPRTWRSPNIHKTSGTKMKRWGDILLKFSTDTQQLLSPLADKLNMRSIGALQDILVHLQNIKIYETLCSQIRSQKICDQLSEVRNTRVAETKMLLYKLAYEKAKQQLMSVNREQMLKKAQQLSSAVQKSQMLNSNRKCLFFPGDVGTTIRDDLGSKDEVAMEKVSTKKHELEALDRKIMNLSKVFHSYCKMKGEPGCSETIVMLNDHLKKKTSCRFIHEDLQLWEVDDFGNRNGTQNIALNYQNLVIQRFVINDGPIPSIFVSNKLDDLNIAKNFPNMDACMAFAFVLNVKTTKKHVGSKSFAQETQITCSLLHNLLDVVGEVQLAQVEVRSLVRTSFHSSSGEQLDLQLFFIDPNSGMKVLMTLDITCLNCGVYPSEIFPYRLQALVAGTYMPLAESLSAKIKAAADGLTVGYLRIIRLCRCISQVLESLST